MAIVHLGRGGVEAVALYPMRLADQIPRWIDGAGGEGLEIELPAAFDYRLRYKGGSTRADAYHFDARIDQVLPGAPVGTGLGREAEECAAAALSR